MHIRSLATALVMFFGVLGTMVPLGAVLFEETAHLALYATGTTGGAGWLAWGTYRSSRPED
jgi:hypothetical protein